MALLTLPRPKGSALPGGRVLLDESGQAMDIIEQADLARQSIVDELTELLQTSSADEKLPKLSSATILSIIEKHIPKPEKQLKAVSEIIQLAHKSKTIDAQELAQLLASTRYHLLIAGRRYTAAQIERLCAGINPSMYLFRSDVFYQGMSMLKNDNAQGEYYLTDVVKCLAGARDDQGKPRYKIRTVPAADATWVQGFNSPDELLTIQDYVRRKNLTQKKSRSVQERPLLKKNQYCSVQQWLSKIEDEKPSIKRWLTGIYGRHEELHVKKIADLLSVLQCYGKRFGFDQKVCIVRAPGRLNLMGRHVDHRGGSTNFLAIDRETLVVAGLRDDNNVVAVNTEPRKFKPLKFNISEQIGRFAWSDWVNFVNSDWVRNLLNNAHGDWSNYIKAAVLRLQHQFQDIRVRGLNLAITGNVPIAAGLSSSSTLVVSTLQAAIALNGFELTCQQFIDLCGEGEWFVGSRGGAGDHAAIYLGQRGKIANVSYLPFRVGRIIDAPEDYRILIANSHIKAAKSSTAKHTFNEKVASYNLGLAVFKQRCPHIANAVQYVRDIDPEKLGCTMSEIYRMLLKVPQFMTRDDFRSVLSAEYREMMEIAFATHAEPETYNPRGVLLFGTAEIMRSKICVDLLESNRIEEFGRLMAISHDGDRVAKSDGNGSYQPWEENCTDRHLRQLIADLESEDPNRVLAAQLYMQPGNYRCSMPQIDEMVDIAAAQPGVGGVQLAGAGLGGCIMILVHRDHVDATQKALAKLYYRPKNLKPAVVPCIAAEGAGLAEF